MFREEVPDQQSKTARRHISCAVALLKYIEDAAFFQPVDAPQHRGQFCTGDCPVRVKQTVPAGRITIQGSVSVIHRAQIF